jgi:hypothetical protein
MKSRTVLAIVVGLPVLFLGSCVYRMVSQINGLKDLCRQATPGTPLTQVVEGAAINSAFRLRTGGDNGKNEGEWFDREYLRIGKELREARKVMSDYTVVFAKPGIGYYACVVTHRDGRIETATYLSRGD